MLSCGCGQVAAADKLYEDFREPPAGARPFVRWWWNGDRVVEDEILRELDLLKAAGIGGVEINPIAMPEGATPTDDKALVWLSDEWNRILKVAIEGARQRGMITDLIVGTGWPFGGRFLEAGEMIQGVGLNKMQLKGPGTFRANIKELMKPPKAKGEVEKPGEPQLLFIRLVPGKVDGLGDIIDLANKVGRDGTIEFEIPQGLHTLYVGTLQENFRAVAWGAPGADGPVVDHYNKKAVEKYLSRTSSKLGPALGGKLGDSIRAMFCDSIELAGANWTSDFEQQFEKRRGYSLGPYLPFVFEIAAPQQESSFVDTILRARYDYYKTLAELFHENFIETFVDWCHDNGTLSRYQAYGIPWLMGMHGGYMIPDIPEGDTWIHYHSDPVGPALDDIRYAVWNKYASSAGHLKGRRLVACESMTDAMKDYNSGVFRASLEDIKQADDLTFITGVNHSILHGFNYSPPAAGFPGWMRYGTYFSEQNPWWAYLKKWTDYNARLSSVFQTTQAQAEVAILGPSEDVWSRYGLFRPPFLETPWYLHSLWQAIHNNGFCADYVSAAVVEAADFAGGKLRFGPMAYDVLMLTDVQTLRPETARAIERFAKAGGKVIFVAKTPSRSPGLKNAEKNDKIVKDAISKVLNTDKRRVALVDGPKEDDLLGWASATLAKVGARPAVRISKPDPRLFQIHHRKDGRDIFFFVNLHRDKKLSFQAHFASTGDKTPWRWDPETGQRTVFPYEDQKNKLDISLKGLESLLLVFEPDMPGKAVTEPVIEWQDFLQITGPWQVRLEPVQGGTFKRTFTQLEDLGKSTDPRLRTFAGTVVYRARFDVREKFPARLDLGKVYNISEVKLNDRSLGLRWWGRHRYDVGGALKAGENVLEVKVTTVLSNYCRSLRDNTTAQIWAAKRGQIPTGLLGPVKLLRGKK